MLPWRAWPGMWMTRGSWNALGIKDWLKSKASASGLCTDTVKAERRHHEPEKLLQIRRWTASCSATPIFPLKKMYRGSCCSIPVPLRIKGGSPVIRMEGSRSWTVTWKPIMFFMIGSERNQGIGKISMGLPAFEITRIRLINRSPRYGKSCGCEDCYVKGR